MSMRASPKREDFPKTAEGGMAFTLALVEWAEVATTYIELQEQENKTITEQASHWHTSYSDSEAENALLKEMLQYVANEHLCGTWLLEEMKKQGIEYDEKQKEWTTKKKHLL